MNRYAIIELLPSGAGGLVCHIDARNGKSALKKFMKDGITSTGMYEIYKSNGFWEMSSTYGRRWCAIEDKDRQKIT